MILADEDRPNTNADIDNVISAQFPPDPNNFPLNSNSRKQAIRLEAIILKNMLHGPCGKLNPSSPCMQDGKCSKGFPKQYCEKTVVMKDNSYPEYQRLSPVHGGQSVVSTVKSKNCVIDNRWIVPHSPYLLLRYNAHINVELCMSPLASKYLFK